MNEHLARQNACVIWLATLALRRVLKAMLTFVYTSYKNLCSLNSEVFLITQKQYAQIRKKKNSQTILFPPLIVYCILQNVLMYKQLYKDHRTPRETPNAGRDSASVLVPKFITSEMYTSQSAQPNAPICQCTSRPTSTHKMVAAHRAAPIVHTRHWRGALRSSNGTARLHGTLQFVRATGNIKVARHVQQSRSDTTWCESFDQLS